MFSSIRLSRHSLSSQDWQLLFSCLFLDCLLAAFFQLQPASRIFLQPLQLKPHLQRQSLTLLLSCNCKAGNPNGILFYSTYAGWIYVLGLIRKQAAVTGLSAYATIERTSASCSVWPNSPAEHSHEFPTQPSSSFSYCLHLGNSRNA